MVQLHANMVSRYGLHVAANMKQATTSTCSISLTQDVTSRHRHLTTPEATIWRSCNPKYVQSEVNSLTHPGTIARAYSTAVTVPATLDLEKMVLRK